MWLGEENDATQWSTLANRLSRRILKQFWKPNRGLLHTLNHVGKVQNPHIPGYGDHYHKTYMQKIRKGPSGPSRQANALAVLAGVLPPAAWPSVLNCVFDNPRITPVVTAYFGYYEQSARGLCGGPCRSG
jgi:hypothetical protein